MRDVASRTRNWRHCAPGDFCHHEVNFNHRPERVGPAFEVSLHRLRLDYLDLYIIHTPFAFQPGDDQDPRDQNGKVLYDNGVTLLDTWRAMESLVDGGRCRAVGLSEIPLDNLLPLYESAKIKPTAVQVESRPYLPETELLEFCKKNGTVLLAFAPLSHGMRPGLLEDPVISAIAALLAHDLSSFERRNDLGHTDGSTWKSRWRRDDQSLTKRGWKHREVKASDLGGFSFDALAVGEYTLEAECAGFASIERAVIVTDGAKVVVDLRFARLASTEESVTVTADVSDVGVFFSDPAERIMIRDETLDANPGRPGMPISISGLRVESPAGGMKPPQY